MKHNINLELEAFNRQQGKLLQRARREKNLSQRKVAAHFGVSQNMISKYERGYTPVPPYYLSQFSQMYEKPVTFFFMVNPSNLKKRN